MIASLTLGLMGLRSVYVEQPDLWVAVWIVGSGCAATLAWLIYLELVDAAGEYDPIV